MTILSDKGILAAIEAGDLGITPWSDEALQPCSVDLHLDPSYRRIRREGLGNYVDMAAVPEQHTTLVEGSMDEPIIVQPGEPILMSTLESVTIGDGLAASIDGKSSIGRLFQAVHITAGWIDAGFSGQITLEVINHLPVPVIYHPGQPIGQLVIFTLDQEAANPYSRKGHYHGQVGPIESKYRIPAYTQRLGETLS